MASISNLSVILSANSSGFNAAMAQATRSLRLFEASARRGLGAGTQAMSDLGLPTNFQGIVNWGVSVAAANEQAQISFEVLLGSAEKAKALLAEINKFAAATPFESKDIRSAAQQLMNYGIAAKDIIPVLKIVGDAAAASPAGIVQGMESINRAFGQIKKATKVTADNMRQLTEAGVDAWGFLARGMGKSIAEVKDLAEAGQIDAAAGILAMLDGMQKKTAGMMDKQSQTLMGLFSTIKDEASQTLGAVAEELIKAFGVKDGMRGIITWLQDVRANVNRFVQDAQGAIQVFINIKDGAVAAFGAVAAVVKTAIAELNGVTGAWKDIRTDTEKVRDVTINVMEMIALAVQSVIDVFRNLQATIIEVGIASAKLSLLFRGFDPKNAKFIAAGFDIMQRAANKLRVDGAPGVRKFFDEVRKGIAQADAAAKAAPIHGAMMGLAGAGKPGGGGGIAQQVVDVKKLALAWDATSLAMKAATEASRELTTDIKNFGLSKEQVALRDLRNEFAKMDLIKDPFKAAQAVWLGANLDRNIKKMKELKEQQDVSNDVFERARQILADKNEPKFAEAVTAGSREAYSAVIRASAGTERKSPTEAIQEAKRQIEAEHAKDRALMKETNDFLKSKGLPLVVKKI